MQQLEFFDIPSPCIGVCQSGPSGYCLGCYRSRDERLYWVQLDAFAKRAIVKACAKRKQRALLAKRSKSAADNSPVQGDFWSGSED